MELEAGLVVLFSCHWQRQCIIRPDHCCLLLLLLRLLVGNTTGMLCQLHLTRVEETQLQVLSAGAEPRIIQLAWHPCCIEDVKKHTAWSRMSRSGQDYSASSGRPKSQPSASITGWVALNTTYTFVTIEVRWVYSKDPWSCTTLPTAVTCAAWRPGRAQACSCDCWL